MASAAVLAASTVIENDHLVENSATVGAMMLDRFKSLQEKYEFIGDVRGSGLFLGIELVRHRQTLEPATAEASFITDQMREHGILLGTDGPFHNVLKIRPPMPFDEENADFLVGTLDRILGENFSG